MFGKKLTAAMASLIFILGAQMAMGKRVDGTTTYKGLSASPNFFTVSGASIVLAQNNSTAPDDNEKSKSGTEAKGSEAESERAEDEKKSSQSKSKPLKPFIPSEKIPGDQAVDFPVDI